MTSRPIAAVDLPGALPGLPPTKAPEITWMEPCELLVDETYQRSIGDKGLRLIRKIVENFDWRRFKPPTAVWTENGLEVIDGQHTAIAAATHPDIVSIPVVVVEAEEISDRAGAFLGINRDRLGVTAMQIHAAAVVACDKQAMAIERVCSAAGVRVLRHPPSNGAYKPRDTVAIRGIADLVRRAGEPVAVQALQILAEANLTPVTGAALRAVEAMLVDQEYTDLVEPAEVTRAIVALGVEADKEAAVFAATHCVPKWRGLVAVWFRKAKKRKSRADGFESPGQIIASNDAQAIVPLMLQSASESTLRSSPLAKRFLGGGGRVSGTSATLIGTHTSLGDPPPGRSALDQRRTEGAQ